MRQSLRNVPRATQKSCRMCLGEVAQTDGKTHTAQPLAQIVSPTNKGFRSHPPQKTDS